MSRFFSLAIRLVMIVMGFATAALTASAFYVVVTAGSTGIEHAQQDELDRIGLFVAAGLGTLFIGYYSFLPAMAIIVVAEILAKRDWLFHALGGAAVAIAGLALYWNTGDNAEADTSMMMLALAAGICAGLAYWLVAGRNSGSWHRKDTPEDATLNPPEEF